MRFLLCIEPMSCLLAYTVFGNSYENWKILYASLFVVDHIFIISQVLDASWYMPDEQRNPIQEYQVLIIAFSTIYLVLTANIVKWL